MPNAVKPEVPGPCKEECHSETPTKTIELTRGTGCDGRHAGATIRGAVVLAT